MGLRKIGLLVGLLSMALVACGPKPPDAEQVKQIVARYLQQKIQSAAQIKSLEITSLEKKSDSCTVHFRGVFAPAGNPQNLHAMFMGAISKNSSFLEYRIAGLEEEETIDAFMILVYADGRWEISKHVPSVLIPGESGEK